MPYEEEGDNAPNKLRNATDFQQTTKNWEKGMEQILLHSPQKEPTLTTLISDFPPPEL